VPIAPEANLFHMSTLTRFFSAAAAVLTVAFASLVTPSRQAEPPELDCTGDAPCAAPQLVALPPDGPDGGADAGPPLSAQIVETAGATAGALPPYVEDNSTPLRHHVMRPMPQADEGWLGATAPSPVPLG
jgi:hypothetical protein